MGKIAVLLAAFILLFGCTIPFEPSVDANLTQLPKAPKQNLTFGDNSANSSVEKLGNKTAANKTVALPPEPALVPRNVSDKIYDGQYDVPDPSESPLKIYVINAGNGDAVLLNKGEFNMLIDDGNAELVHPYLKKLGVGRLDALVVTKDDPNAFSGAELALDEFSVGEIWENGNARVSEGFSLLRKKAAGEKIAVKHPKSGDKMEIGGLGVVVLNPQRDERQNANPDNDAIVLKVKNGEFCIILLNPIVQEWETPVLREAEKDGARCNVITYFKHGEGRPIPSLAIEKIAPRDVIISVGANTEGLPSPTTLILLALPPEGKQVWRTDTNGTIRIVNYGHSAYEITPQAP